MTSNRGARAADDDANVKAYAGICPDCNRLVFVSVDQPEYAKDNAKEVAKLIRAGYRVESWTVPQVRASGKFGHADDCVRRSAKRKGGVR